MSLDSYTQKTNQYGHRCCLQRGINAIVVLYPDQLSGDAYWSNVVGKTTIQADERLIVTLRSNQSTMTIYKVKVVLNLASITLVPPYTNTATMDELSLIAEYFINTIKTIGSVNVVNEMGFKLFIYLPDTHSTGINIGVKTPSPSDLWGTTLPPNHSQFKLVMNFDFNYTLVNPTQTFIPAQPFTQQPSQFTQPQTFTQQTSFTPAPVHPSPFTPAPAPQTFTPAQPSFTPAQPSFTPAPAPQTFTPAQPSPFTPAPAQPSPFTQQPSFTPAPAPQTFTPAQQPSSFAPAQPSPFTPAPQVPRPGQPQNINPFQPGFMGVPVPKPAVQQWGQPNQWNK